MAEGADNPALEGIKDRVAALSHPDPSKVNRVRSTVRPDASNQFKDVATGYRQEFGKQTKKNPETTRTSESTIDTWAFRLVAEKLGDTQDQDILEATEHSSSPQVGRVLRDVLQRIDRREGDAKLWTYNNILAELRTEMKQDKLDSFKLMSGDESDFPSLSASSSFLALSTAHLFSHLKIPAFLWLPQTSRLAREP